MRKFIGRKDFLEDLESLWRKQTSSLVACRGRRRIGKSTLFREFSRLTAECCIEIEGLAPEKNMTDQDQLDGFAASLARETQTPLQKFTNWLDAFYCLDHAIDDKRRTVVVLDEISWMGGYNPLFPSILRKAWERYFHRHDKLIFVICGSVSAWIKENLLDSTGFAGRFSRDYVLPELSLDESVQFWGEAANRVAPRELLDVLSVTGGVPRYLEEVDPSLSADENIRRMCFVEDGPLFKDFNAIFSEVFGETSLVKADILRRLSAGAATCSELADRLGVERGGSLSRNLAELCEAGFIAKDDNVNPATGRKSKLARYRVGDNYTRFYLKYVEPHEGEIRSGRYGFGSLSCLAGWDVDKGLQFENLVANHAMALMPYLHLDGITVKSAAPFLLKGKRGEKKGVQIDLLVQTSRVVYLVEVKRRAHIGREIESEIAAKVDAFPKKRGVSIRTALVYDGELDAAVARSGVFDTIIPFSQLLGLGKA